MAIHKSSIDLTLCTGLLQTEDRFQILYAPFAVVVQPDSFVQASLIQRTFYLSSMDRRKFKRLYLLLVAYKQKTFSRLKSLLAIEPSTYGRPANKILKLSLEAFNGSLYLIKAVTLIRFSVDSSFINFPKTEALYTVLRPFKCLHQAHFQFFIGRSRIGRRLYRQKPF